MRANANLAEAVLKINDTHDTCGAKDSADCQILLKQAQGPVSVWPIYILMLE